MSDYLGAARVVTAPFHAAMADIRKASDRAAMWAVRESARKTGRAAKRHAPVLTGAYKRSIRSSKRLKRTEGGYGVVVGPRGPKVHLYAQKIEAKYSPMTQGFDEVRGSIGAIHEKAMARALARYVK